MLELEDLVLVFVNNLHSLVNDYRIDEHEICALSREYVPKSIRLWTRSEASAVARNPVSLWRRRAAIGSVKLRLGVLLIEITVPRNSCKLVVRLMNNVRILTITK